MADNPRNEARSRPRASDAGARTTPGPGASPGEPQPSVIPISLTFGNLHEQNVSRLARWHDPDSEPWTGADWSNAMGGESGEAQNVVKKLRRHETRTSPQGDPDEATLRSALADELADVVIYADLLAHHYGIDLGQAVARKFNRKSIEQGFPERLPELDMRRS